MLYIYFTLLYFSSSSSSSSSSSKNIQVLVNTALRRKHKVETHSRLHSSKYVRALQQWNHKQVSITVNIAVTVRFSSVGSGSRTVKLANASLYKMSHVLVFNNDLFLRKKVEKIRV